jgi:hypothetical protein
VQPWNANSTNTRAMVGHVYLGSTPVVGARLRVDLFRLPLATGPQGGFTYPADATWPGRHEVRVIDASNAKVNGRKLTASERNALESAGNGFDVGYAIRNAKARMQDNGTVLVTGRLESSDGAAPPPVGLYTYSLNGTITDAGGKPVQGAVVVCRTNDRDFWTFSAPSDANGRYTSFFHASDETAADPVTLNVGVALGATSYGGNVGTAVQFKRNQSATMDIQLGTGTRYTIAKPQTVVGAIYEGPIIGVASAGRVVKPVAARWPTTNGTFSMTLPASVRGHTISFWQSRRLTFSTFAASPGSRIDLKTWPERIARGTPSQLAFLSVPRR